EPAPFIEQRFGANRIGALVGGANGLDSQDGSQDYSRMREGKRPHSFLDSSNGSAPRAPITLRTRVAYTTTQFAVAIAIRGRIEISTRIGPSFPFTRLRRKSVTAHLTGC